MYFIYNNIRGFLHFPTGTKDFEDKYDSFSHFVSRYAFAGNNSTLLLAEELEPINEGA